MSSTTATPTITPDVDAPMRCVAGLTKAESNVLRVEHQILRDLALDATDPIVQAYHAGAYNGYGIALGLHSVDALVEARTRVAFAACLTLDEFLGGRGAQQCSDDAAATARASGLLWGWKQATRFHAGADECGECAQRLMPFDDTDECPKQLGRVFCGWDLCRSSAHLGAPCSECDAS